MGSVFLIWVLVTWVYSLWKFTERALNFNNSLYVYGSSIYNDVMVPRAL